jgi:hypothetical protein
MIITMRELFKRCTTKVLIKTTAMFTTVEQHNKLISITETNTDGRKVELQKLFILTDNSTQQTPNA